MNECGTAGGGDIPDTWCSLAIDEAAEIAPGVPIDSLPDDHLVHFVPMASVAEDFAGVDVKQLRPLQEVRKGYTAFVAGDVLFAGSVPFPVEIDFSTYMTIGGTTARF